MTSAPNHDHDRPAGPLSAPYDPNLSDGFAAGFPDGAGAGRYAGPVTAPTMPQQRVALAPTPPSPRSAAAPPPAASAGGTERVQRLRQQVLAQVRRHLYSQPAAIDYALVGLLCGGHVLFEAVPGVGKTTLAKALAAVTGMTFQRVQGTPDLLPTAVTGAPLYNQRSGEFEMRPGPLFANVVLVDEINRATPKTQSTFLEGMEEGAVTVDGVTYPLPRPFLLLATQNPVEFAGTYPLPEAQLDRFLLCVRMGYPTADEERALLAEWQPPALVRAGRGHGASATPLDRVIANADQVADLQATVASIAVAPVIYDWLVDLGQATREATRDVTLGLSPRGLLAVRHAAQAWAAINGRGYVTPGDVDRVWEPVVAHRLILANPNQDASRIARDIFSNVPAPTWGPGGR